SFRPTEGVADIRSTWRRIAVRDPPHLSPPTPRKSPRRRMAGTATGGGVAERGTRERRRKRGRCSAAARADASSDFGRRRCVGSWRARLVVGARLRCACGGLGASPRPADPVVRTRLELAVPALLI